MKIRPVGAELSHADGHKDHSRFSQFCERALKLVDEICACTPTPFQFPDNLRSKDVLDTDAKRVMLSAPAELTTFNHFGDTVPLTAGRGMNLNCVHFEILQLEIIDPENTNFTISFSRFPTVLIFSLTPDHKQVLPLPRTHVLSVKLSKKKTGVDTITWTIHKTNHALVPFGSPMKPKATATYRA